MAFDLHVTFAGLCLLVEDPHAPGGKPLLHVLMPRTGSTHPHLARLMYNKGHELPLGTPLPSSETRILDDRQVAIPQLSTDALNLNLKQSNIFDLGTFIGSGVQRALVDTGDASSEPNQVISRI